jgi:hypothetical protein
MKLQFMSKAKSILAFLVLSAGALTADAQVGVSVHVGIRPPPVRVERVPEMRPGHVWAPGYWGWNGGTHVWYGGHWEGERPGYRYVPAAWVFVGNEWVFNDAYWQPYAPVIVQPAPIVVQQAPPQYVEQPQAAPAPPNLDPRFWYYCRNPAGYYPYVQNCSLWQQVTPPAR